MYEFIKCEKIFLMSLARFFLNVKKMEEQLKQI